MRIPSVTGFALLASLSACAAHTAARGAPPSVSDADDQETAELKEHHRHHHHGGVTHFIAMSLDTLGTDDAKRGPIEKLQNDLQVCMAPAKEVERKLLLAFADGIAGGALVSSSIDPLLTQLDTTAAAVRDCSVDSLNKLHALLSPVERRELAEKVQAHWQVWRQVNHDEAAGGRERGGRLADLAQDLNLTPDQVGKISTALHAAQAANLDSKRGQSHVQAFAAGFASESFDAKAIAENANGQLANHGGLRMAAFYEAVTPVLTPEQRTKLADHVREHANHQPAAVSAN